MMVQRRNSSMSNSGGGGGGHHQQKQQQSPPFKQQQSWFCNQFVKTGECKFGQFCRYEHPPPINVNRHRQDLPMAAQQQQRRPYMVKSPQKQ